MSTNGPPPCLPRGVTEGLWEYVHRPAIARQYDDYFAYNQLFRFDLTIVGRLLADTPPTPDRLVVDLGCGTGRASFGVARWGYRCLAVDMSPHMLDIVRQRVRQTGLPIHCVRANLVELDCLADGCCQVALCLFSTLGMISDRRNRRQCLRHVRRILSPGGQLVLHVHNYWYHLYDRRGPAWLVRNLVRWLLLRDVERGDKVFAYRGVSNMFLHVFRGSELRRALADVGFHVREWIPLSASRDRRLRWSWFLGNLRANGWIVICD